MHTRLYIYINNIFVRRAKFATRVLDVELVTKCEQVRRRLNQHERPLTHPTASNCAQESIFILALT